MDEISEPQTAPTIFAGFCRYGQIIGRMLLAQGIAPTVLDHDAELIESARSFGYRVFYDDATRLDLLRIAGAASAKILVVAVEQSMKIVDLAKENFPRVMRVERELFESSLRILPAWRCRRAADRALVDVLA